MKVLWESNFWFFSSTKYNIYKNVKNNKKVKRTTLIKPSVSTTSLSYHTKTSTITIPLDPPKIYFDKTPIQTIFNHLN